jgi:hypothetical protein
MFKSIKESIKTIVIEKANKMIAKAYVKQCQQLADGDDMKLRDYLMPPTQPICLFVKIDKTDGDGTVLDGEFVVVKDQNDAQWVLTFDDYIHAGKVCDQYEKVTGTRPAALRTSPESVFTQEHPVMGAICCKVDGTEIETHKGVWRTLYKAMIIKARLEKARANELRKRMEQDSE